MRVKTTARKMEMPMVNLALQAIVKKGQRFGRMMKLMTFAVL